MKIRDPEPSSPPPAKTVLGLTAKKDTAHPLLNSNRTLDGHPTQPAAPGPALESHQGGTGRASQAGGRDLQAKKSLVSGFDCGICFVSPPVLGIEPRSSCMLGKEIFPMSQPFLRNKHLLLVSRMEMTISHGERKTLTF